MKNRRKKYIIYPPNYTPGDGYVTKFSKRQAKKQCYRFGVGATIHINLNEQFKDYQVYSTIDVLEYIC